MSDPPLHGGKTGYSVENESDQQRYLCHGKIGEGAFGDVRRGTDSLTGKVVALKYIRILNSSEGLPRAVFREIEALRQLSEGTHIVSLLDVFPDESNLCLVLDYHPSDLSEVISQAKSFLPVAHVKAYSRMLLDALAFIHARCVIHRDIKPSNILVSSAGSIKLADFGLARVLLSDSSHTKNEYGGVLAPTPASGHEAQELSHQVATRWYRPPELLFASRSYTFSADIWSAGAVIAELFSLKPLFPGANDIDQMFRVFQIMGSPTVECWPGVDQLPDFDKVCFPGLRALDFSLLIPHLHNDDNAFLKTMLVLDPTKRLAAADICASTYFLSYPLPTAEAYLPCPPRKCPKSRAKETVSTENGDAFSAHLPEWQKEDLRVANLLSEFLKK